MQLQIKNQLLYTFITSNQIYQWAKVILKKIIEENLNIIHIILSSVLMKK